MRSEVSGVSGDIGSSSSNEVLCSTDDSTLLSYDTTPEKGVDSENGVKLASSPALVMSISSGGVSSSISEHPSSSSPGTASCAHCTCTFMERRATVAESASSLTVAVATPA